jgi:hypothetical protein
MGTENSEKEKIEWIPDHLRIFKFVLNVFCFLKTWLIDESFQFFFLFAVFLLNKTIDGNEVAGSLFYLIIVILLLK